MYNDSNFDNDLFSTDIRRPLNPDTLKLFDEQSTQKLVAVKGIVRYEEIPGPDERIFRFSADTIRGPLKMQIDREAFYGRIVLAEDCLYNFEYVEENGVCDVKIFTQVKEENFAFEDITQKDMLTSYKLKLSAIKEKKLAIKLSITGTVVNVVESDGKIIGFQFEYEGATYHVFQRNKIFNDIYTVNLKKGMILSLDGLLVGNRLYAISYLDVSDMYFLKEELGEEQYGQVYIKLLAMSDERRNDILNLFKHGKKNPVAELDSSSAFSDLEGMRQKYELCKEYYPIEVQRAVEKTLNDMHMRRDRRQAILDLLINTRWGDIHNLSFDYETIKAKLDSTHYGQEYLKEYIIKMLLAYKYKTKKKGCVILVCGGPGIGKTSIFRSACEASGIPFAKVSLNGVDTPLFLKGSPRLYENAINGSIISTIRQVGDHSLILLDEVDKMAKEGRDGNPYAALYDLLDRDEKFQDSLIEEGLDLSNVIFVLTANDMSDVPPAILDRVNVIHISDYTEEEKRVIAKDYVIPKQMSKYDFNGKSIVWTEEVIDDIANKFTLTNGVRDIEKNVESIINTALTQMDKNGNTEIAVDKTNIEELVDIAPCRRGKVEHDISGLKNKFRYFKYEYSEEVRSEVLMMLQKYDGSKDVAEKEAIRKRLFAIVNILPSENEETYDLKGVRDKLDVTHDGMEDVKEQIMMSLAGINATKKNTARCLLLDGPYGVGKTSIAEAIAEAMHRKFIKISMNGVKTPQYIKGFERTYKDSEYGVVVKNLAECGTDNVLILFDEIDKMKVSADSDPYSAFIDLFDDSGMFTDTYCGVPMNMSNVFFIATSNHKENIPECLLDRMEIIELTGYTKSEKTRIAKEHIIPKKLKKYGVEGEFVIDSDTAEYITTQYCKAYGLRDIDKAVDKVIRKALKKRECGEDVKINIEMVKHTLGARPLKRGNVPSADRMRPGIARALAVSGNTGTTFAVQVTENVFGDGDEITGLPKQSTLDSIKIAKLLVSKILGKELTHIHIHFAEGGIEKDGPSAGITIFSAIYSYFTNTVIDRKVAFTGEIDIYGDVWAIGGTELKITAAINEGCDKVFIPIDNYIQLEEEGKLSKYNCEIIAVSNIEELCSRLFVNQK